MADVVWSNAAIRNLEAIREYVARDSSDAADRLIADIGTAVFRHAEFPLSGRRVPEVDDSDIREFIHGEYRIIYSVSRNCLHVITVLHGRRDPYLIFRALGLI